MVESQSRCVLRRPRQENCRQIDRDRRQAKNFGSVRGAAFVHEAFYDWVNDAEGWKIDLSSTATGID
jgi:hypothetical protein